MSDGEYVWYTEDSRRFMSKGYLGGLSLDDRVSCIGDTAEAILKVKGFSNKLKSYIKKGWVSLSTPVWCNFGNSRGLPISCFSSRLEDSVQSILDNVAEIGTMTKLGGGTAAYFGDVRPRGAPISIGGNSFGTVHFMKLFDSALSIISQSNVRRGNAAMYLPIEHGDLFEFLKVRTNESEIQSLTTAVCVSDNFMERMIARDKDAGDRWAAVLKSRYKTGVPYVIFTDNANKGAPDVYKDKGLKIVQSNLCCVTGDQRVVSDRGMKTAKQLWEEGGNLKLFDGKNVVDASPMQLIEKNVKVFKITLANGMTHTVTGDHKVAVRKFSYNSKGRLDVRCEDLKVGDQVAVQLEKGLFGAQSREDEAFILGLYQADGTNMQNSVCIDLWENDFDLVDEVETKVARIVKSCKNLDVRTKLEPKFTDANPGQSKVKKKRMSSVALDSLGYFVKGKVPNWMWEADEKTQWAYLRGLYYADGTVRVGAGATGPVQLSLASVDRKFLEDLQLIVSNLGIKSSIFLLYPAGRKLLPDGKGGKKYYDTQTSWRLVNGNKHDLIEFDRHTGFAARKGIDVARMEFDRDKDKTKKFSEVVSVEPVGYEDVYCCQVDSASHHWVCNGVVTHNSEIFLPTTEEESFVCCLSSMNDLYFDDWKDTDAVETMTRLLDAVMSEFITKAKTIKHMERAVRFAERHRALGLGRFGYHSYLQSRELPFESSGARKANIAISKTIKQKAYDESKQMAKDYGEPEVMKGYGRRNSTLIAIAPTKSSAFIIGQASESIEPNDTNFEIADLAKGKYEKKNPFLMKLLNDLGKNTPEVLASISKANGSVQHLDFLTNEQKEVFRTFSEISQKEVVIQAAQRQKYIDQGQSLNLYVPGDAPVKDLNALMIDAWSSGIKSLYYQYNDNSAQKMGRDLLTACKSCEA